MRWILLGLLMTIFFFGFFSGLAFIVTAIVTWYAPPAGLGFVLLIIGLASALGATYL
jgi:hypothetical protein